MKGTHSRLQTVRCCFGMHSTKSPQIVPSETLETKTKNSEEAAQESHYVHLLENIG